MHPSNASSCARSRPRWPRPSSWRRWAPGAGRRPEPTSSFAETSGHPGELEAAVRDLAGRQLLTRRGGRWELDLCSLDLSSPAAPSRFDPGSAGRRPRGSRTPAFRAGSIGRALGRARREHARRGADPSRRRRPASRRRRGASLFPAGRLAGRGERAFRCRSAGRRTCAPRVSRAISPRGARHLFRADAHGRARAALAAARDRLRGGAPLEAARLYQIARAGLRHPFSSLRAALLCERAADCLALAGQPAAARLEYAQALARGGAPGRIWQKIAKARWQEGRFEQVLEALARARSAGADPLAVTTVEARAEAMRGEYSRAEELAAAALPLARERRDEEAATRLHHLLGTCAWHRGEGRRAVAEERAAVLIARRRGDRRAEADALAGLGTAYRVQASYRDRPAKPRARSSFTASWATSARRRSPGTISASRAISPAIGTAPWRPGRS